MSSDLLWLTNIATPYTVPLWRELAKQCDAIFACMARAESNRDWQVDMSGVPVEMLDCRSLQLNYETRLYLPNLKLLRLLLLRRPRTVVIDGWESPAGLTAFVVAKLLRSRVVVSYWSTPHTHRFHGGPVVWARRLIFRTCDRVYTPGSAARQAAILAGAAPERVVTGFPTIDTTIFNRDRQSVDESVGSEESRRRATTYIYAGQFIERKNVATLLEAFADLPDQSRRLLLAGDGPLRPHLESLTQTLRLDDRVEFLGNLQPKELREAFARADTLVLPSTEEVWGLVVNEALHAGLRVIVSDCCGVAADIDKWPGVTITAITRASIAKAIGIAPRIPRPRNDHPIHRQTPEALARLLTSSLIGRAPSTGP